MDNNFETKVRSLAYCHPCGHFFSDEELEIYFKMAKEKVKSCSVKYFNDDVLFFIEFDSLIHKSGCNWRFSPIASLGTPSASRRSTIHLFLREQIHSCKN